MSVARTINSKAATLSIWGIFAVFFAAMFLHANYSTITSSFGFAKPAAIEGPALGRAPAATGPRGSDTLEW